MAKQPIEEVNQEVDLEVGAVKIVEQRCNNWKEAWKKLRKYMEDGGVGGGQNKKKNFKEKKVQSELLKNVDDDEHRCFHCNADPKKTAAILNQQHQMIETIK